MALEIRITDITEHALESPMGVNFPWITPGPEERHDFAFMSIRLQVKYVITLVADWTVGEACHCTFLLISVI
jgi:hypothetical protein